MPTPRKYENAAARHAAYRKRQAEARLLERSRKGLPPTPPIPTMPGEARWKQMLAEAGALLSMVVEEREAYHDDRSEDWRDSEKGETFQERTDTVIDLLASLEELGLSS